MMVWCASNRAFRCLLVVQAWFAMVSDVDPVQAQIVSGYWSFDDTNSLGADGSTFGNDLTAEGGVSFDANGYSGGALSLDGVDGMLTGDPFSSVPVGDAPYGVSLWMKPNAPTNPQGAPSGMIGWGGYGSGRQVNAFRMFGDNGFRHYWWGADLDAQDSQVSDLGVDLDDGQWHHAVATYDGQTRKLFLDGQELVSDIPGTADVVGDNFAIGRTCDTCGGGEFFDGMLDEISIFNIGLSSKDVTALHSGTSPLNLVHMDDPAPAPPPPEEGLVGLWQFENSSNLGFDSSNLGNHLEVDGGVDFDADGKFGGAGFFDGFDGMLIHPDDFPDGIPVGDSEYTIALWMKPNAPTNQQGGPSGMIGWGAYGSGSSVNAFRMFNDNGFRHYWWGNDLDAQDFDVDDLGVDLDDGDWHHAVATYDGQTRSLYLNGELLVTDEPNPNNASPEQFAIGRTAPQFNEFFDGLLDDVAVFDISLDEGQIQTVMAGDFSLFGIGGVVLQAGDADQDLDFDQLDLVKVQIAARFLTGQAATWGEGDWDGAPGGEPGSPPAGNGVFDQLDIIAALSADIYLTGPYAAVRTGGVSGDGQTSLVYDSATGELAVDAPAGKELTSINVTSGGGMFVGDKPAVLDGAFDNFAADNVFKATFGGSFGSISFGRVLPAGLTEADVSTDLSAVGSLAGGGDLGDVDLVYVPEPASATQLLLAVLGLSLLGRFTVFRVGGK